MKITPGLPSIRADAQSLERAVTAILDNAIKFSPDGGDVDVEVGPEGGAEKNQVKVIVRDHGVGIPEEAMPQIFKRFFRIEDMGGHLFRAKAAVVNEIHIVRFDEIHFNRRFNEKTGLRELIFE